MGYNLVLTDASTYPIAEARVEGVGIGFDHKAIIKWLVPGKKAIATWRGISDPQFYFRDDNGDFHHVSGKVRVTTVQEGGMNRRMPVLEHVEVVSTERPNIPTGVLKAGGFVR